MNVIFYIYYYLIFKISLLEAIMIEIDSFPFAVTCIFFFCMKANLILE